MDDPAIVLKRGCRYLAGPSVGLTAQEGRDIELILVL
jgi:hypothetical protein